MAKENPFRVIREDGTDPVLVENKRIIKEILTDMLNKVDEESIETIAFVAITSDENIIYGRHVTKNQTAILGALARQCYIVNKLLDDANNVSERTEY